MSMKCRSLLWKKKNYGYGTNRMMRLLAAPAPLCVELIMHVSYCTICCNVYKVSLVQKKNAFHCVRRLFNLLNEGTIVGPENRGSFVTEVPGGRNILGTQSSRDASSDFFKGRKVQKRKATVFPHKS
jgi:hypothetical protein